MPEWIGKLNWIVATAGDLPDAVDTLIGALDTDLDRVRAHSRLLVRAREWDTRGDDKALLLRGSELSEAEALIGTDADPAPTPDQTRFVVASRKAATGRQRGVVGIATVDFIARGAASGDRRVDPAECCDLERWLAIERALDPLARARAAAVDQLGTDPQRSLLLGWRRSKSASTPEAVADFGGRYP